MTLILNLQFWEGDKTQAMALARLLADLEPIKRTDVTFLFSARFDASFCEETIAYVSEKFNVKRFRGKKHETGWPAGPNGMYRESFTHCIGLTRAGVQATGILFIEADCVPLHRNWLSMLIEEWKNCGKDVLGAWFDRSDGCANHINGNCIISTTLWKKHKRITMPGSIGWDVDLRDIMLPNGAPSRLIWSDYGLGKPGYNEWRGCNWLFEPKQYRGTGNPLFGQVLHPVWFHGPKTMDGIECVRQRLLSDTILRKRDVFGALLNSMGLNGEGVEVGVFRGENADTILSSWVGGRLFLVDPWINQSKEEYVDGTQQNDFNEVYESAKARLSKHGQRAWFCKQTSKEYGSSLPSPSERFDFVYIDAKHDYKSVKDDIETWWPTVKKGGILAGHDYQHKSVPGVFDCGVTEAVDEFVRANNLKLHITVDDDVKSWLVVKDA